MKIEQPTYKQFGEKAILIEWKPVINEAILQDILQFKETILTEENIEDIIVGYNSLTLKFEKDIIDFSLKTESLKQLYNRPVKNIKEQKTTWEIPVCYDIDFGIDLQELSEKKKLTVSQIIDIHTKPLYTVYFIGFLPGFLYLGGLDTILHTPRKATPRLHVDKGSVAIGGSQTGIYPQESAGGWHIIGQTPVRFFNTDNSSPCFAKSGDQLKFISISKAKFKDLKAINYQPKKV